MGNLPDILSAAVQARLTVLGVRAEEVTEQFIRGTGAGGQKINKTSSTVWLQHRPTGIVVRCQRERSQRINRLLAWSELAEKLAALQEAAGRQARASRELIRRQLRQKSRGQKARMIEGKKHRAKIKSRRGRPGEE